MQEILKEPNGANFILADLHIHTPSDPRFRKSLGERYHLQTAEGKKQFIRDFYTYAMDEKGLGILAITEHNDVSYLEFYKSVNREKSFRNLIVFPGLEISSKEGIHLLVLFNPDEDIVVLDGFLSEIGLTPGRRKQGSRILASNLSFDDILELLSTRYIEKRKDSNSPRALAIAAHVDQDNGLSKQENAGYYYRHPNLIAVQISKPYNCLNEGLKQIFSGKHQAYGYKRIAVIESSDCRSIECVGKAASYIKISSPTIEGLKQAFLDADSRLRQFEGFTSPGHSRFIAAKWEGGFLDGLTIHFNKNLNCIIGGKGTGKSTILETIRYAFDLEPRSLKGRENFRELLKNVMRSGSKVSLLVESMHLNQRYIIERAYGFPALVTDMEGNRLALSPHDVMPRLEIYGQKEIYEISNNKEFQLSLLSRFVNSEWETLKKEEAQQLNLLNENKIEIVNIMKTIEMKQNTTTELPRLLEELKKFQETQIYQKLHERRNYEEERLLIQKANAKIEAFCTAFNTMLEQIDLTLDFLNDTQIGGLINAASLRKIRTLIQKFESAASNQFKRIELESDEVRASIRRETDDWQAKFLAQEKKYQEQLKQLQLEAEMDPNDLILLARQIAIAKATQESIEQDRARITKLKAQRGELKLRLQKIRQSLFQHLSDVCQYNINKELTGMLKVDVEFEAEKQAFVEYLVELKTGAQRKQLENIVYSEDFTIAHFVDLVQQGATCLTHHFNISDSTADRIYRAFDEEALLELDAFEIPTRATISLNTGTPEHPNYKDTNHLSVGQKCTAILTLILIESPYPLIIDQPEDDLDNSFIFEDIVTKLRMEKERRQFIIATHNANIPVLGDAEEIIVLNSSDRQIESDQVKKGSIDDYLLKEPVERILEGGKQAFELRKMKYGF